ncbi:hypothetical protein [Blastococcus sp. TF02A-30]|uniref:hypothetical protein n=1 Tax=Blastococcus sp. TF02A-30 TaxID=2250580 RepID=UPI000DE8EEEB|nr:hypothetical protein [Blastococcus sp. TF02A-30]RBY86405.1 hypothetical protein DQ241_12735 [Blastococcus sp. TF02A-30]
MTSVIIAVLVVAALALITRWAFGPGYGRGRPRARPEAGLLAPVATVATRSTALALRAVLSDAGIRSTLRSPAPHRTDVLVFPEDAERARALAATFRG